MDQYVLWAKQNELELGNKFNSLLMLTTQLIADTTGLKAKTAPTSDAQLQMRYTGYPQVTLTSYKFGGSHDHLFRFREQHTEPGKYFTCYHRFTKVKSLPLRNSQMEKCIGQVMGVYVCECVELLDPLQACQPPSTCMC